MSKRLQSLDVVRGMTVAGMILVNNGYRGSFQALRHAEWNGLSLSDLVFPFFLFIMGVSIYLSFSGKGFRPDSTTIVKVLKRTLLLFVIGIAINWLEKASAGVVSLQELRFWAVLQRIAICYLCVSIFALVSKHRHTLTLAILLLTVYAVIIIAGNGYSLDRSDNIIHLADSRIFGDAHLYHKSPVDPEGLLSTLPAIANVLFGFYCGMKVKDSSSLQGKSSDVFTIGAILTFAGFIVNFALPYNKHIWSPSFSLVTSGFCALLLALMMRTIDEKGKDGLWKDCFMVFGTNALILYITSEIIAIILGRIGFSAMLFNACSLLIPVSQLASLCYALIYVAINFAIGFPLWRKRIFIKL